ncbi:hypothetical protein CBR_g18728 [Chara braunii]|uniref:Small ribosomal subunit protein uS17c n=1 Tax=Chara braunii TaxID=69332 RepID=A0A388KW96_CHABU|nr:hypothetical protein CBR_g18728 [Chara braunii]|eukprot:GBG74317.1 hypothetical protein CBR_g18728 [Chara braunii]
MKSFVGKVISDKMRKSVVVAVDRLVRHRLYPKTVRRTTKLMAHDEENACKIGDEVRIESSRPLSKRKHWVVTDIIRRMRVYNQLSSAAAVGKNVSSTELSAEGTLGASTTPPGKGQG